MNETKNGKVLTTGLFDNEPLAWEAFDSIIDISKAFKIFREVEGEYIHPRLGTGDAGSRIDRVLIPLQKIMDAGWHGGAIGIEGKRSGKKVGPLITQAMDYSRCVFRIENSPGNLLAMVMLKWIFVYPVESSDIGGGALESLMANHRIGACNISRNCLTFGCSATNAIKIYTDGSLEAKDLPMGNKRGSR